jgi:predicted AAA+ superfamily ATPase
LAINTKQFAIVTVYRAGHNRNTGDATSFQQQYRTQYADETAIVEINPHKQMMIDLEYFTEELKTDGFEVVVFIDANDTLDHRVRSHNHDHKYKSDKGLNIDGSIDGSITTYTQDCVLSNILS